MKISEWDERYRLGAAARSGTTDAPTPLLVRSARTLPPGDALDLACGVGRNALWLARQGWNVTAVDGSAAAIETLRALSEKLAITVDARVADLEQHQYELHPASWDLIAICYYLQRDLFAAAKRALRPGGTLIAIVHITEPGEEPTAHRLRPGELKTFFAGCEILHYREGKPEDTEHQRSVAEIVARR